MPEDPATCDDVRQNAAMGDYSTEPTGSALSDLHGSTTRLELAISTILRLGVILSFAVVVLGLGLLLRSAYAGPNPPGAAVLFPPPEGAAEILRTPAEVLDGLREGHPSAVVSLGLLILLSTPIIRVAASIIGFALQRDWLYVAITFFVLGVLAVSFTIGAVG